MKNHLSDEENKLRSREISNYSIDYPYYNEIIKNMPLFVSRIKSLGLDFVFDLNEAIRYSEESIFTNFWIHCNELGNKMVAEAVVEFLKDKGELC